MDMQYWSVWLHNGYSIKGKDLPCTRLDKGDETKVTGQLDRGEHQLYTAEEAFAFAYSHPEPAVLIIRSPEGECTPVKIMNAERVIPFDSKSSEVPAEFGNGN